mgnify:CR=1 FL=1
MKKEKKIRSLKWKFAKIMLLCWVLPFLVIIGLVGSYMLITQRENQMERLEAQAGLNTRTCAERLNGAISDSRQATYDGTLFEQYRQYRRQGSTGERVFSNGVQNYLNVQYSHRKNNIFTVLMLKEDPLNKHYTSYNFGTGGNYAMIQNFFDKDRDAVLELADTLDTSVGFLKTDSGFYIVRNMMDRSFSSWGILVSRVNVKYCFESVMAAWEDFNIQVNIAGIPVIKTSTQKNDDWETTAENMPEFTKSKGTSYELKKGKVYIFSNEKENDYQLQLVLYAKEMELFRFLYGYFYVIVAMGLLLIPMMLMFMKLSGTELSKPVKKLVECAGEIEKGNLGYQIDTSMKNTEFEYLRCSINQMSGQLKYQFDHIYEEELALRDARIMALQSHINPHFMNNTLEIINWEARLEGNEKVSKMIEALSALMDAAMDRKGLPEVRLSQEMIYVNAYFYIIAERLGKRLTVEKEIPEELMGQMVPRLILQPIIENAIEHGIIPRGGGTVLLKARREGCFLYIEIINDGVFTEENEAKVKRLLAPDYDARKESSGNLGIANVNQRLRILYGNTCGLTIQKYNEEQTISTLTILATA